MPNKFKFNPTGNESNSLFKQTWSIELSQNNTGGGPSSSTGLYNGVTIPSGGTVTYLPNGKAYTSNNTTEFLYFIGTLGGDTSNFYNAVDWAHNNGYLVVSSDLPSVPTDGLIVMLDGTNTASWSGKTWYDLSGANNNANSVGNIYKGDKGLVFDGSSYLQINKSASMDAWSNQQTVAIWMKHNFTSGRRNPWDQAYGGYGTWTHEAGNNINCYFGDAGSNASPYTSGNSSDTIRDQWNLMVTSRDNSVLRWYNNGTLISSRAHSYGSLATTNANVRIGTGYAGTWIGEMGMVMAWNRALSAEEIIELMNNTKNMF